MKFLWIATLLFTPIISEYRSMHYYDVIIDKVEHFSYNDTLWDWREFRPTKYNRTTTVVTGLVDLKQPLTDELEVNFCILYKC